MCDGYFDRYYDEYAAGRHGYAAGRHGGLMPPVHRCNYSL